MQPGAPLSGPRTQKAGGRASAALANVFLSPTRAFQEIARGASWVLPFVVNVVLGLVAVVLYRPMTEAVGQARLEQIPEEQRAAAERMMGVQTTMQTVLAPAQTAIVFLLSALIFTGILRAMKMGIPYKRVFTGLCYAGLIPSVGGVVQSFLANRKAGSGEVAGMEDMPRFGLDLLGGNGFLRGLLSMVNPFSIWWLVVVVFGFAVLCGTTPQKATRPVLTAGLLWLLIGGLFYGLAFAFS